MTLNGSKWLKWLKIALFITGMLQIALNPSQLLQQASKRSKPVQIISKFSKWLEMVQNGLKLFQKAQMSQNGTIWLYVASNGAKKLIIALNILTTKKSSRQWLEPLVFFL